ncbi:AlpA family transcriptional regulator [Parafrankia sp. BMG5.11]|uniref:helix-turn-helix transcriptional regulator n=1 Tax=Parafrankia sp. BMG5.11 TaxID=222540 RepID=UPI001FB380CA|nr:helix-turn-helix domain-containing protein [Parafrankia sp. BMG5.11]
MAEVMTPVLASAPAPDPLLTTRDVSGLLAVHEGTLRSWRSRGVGPQWFSLGVKVVRYRRSVVLAWLEEQEQATGTGAA